MKPKHILAWIVAVIACLAVISWLFPTQGIVLGDVQLRWPSLQQVLTQDPGPDCTSPALDTLSILSTPSTLSAPSAISTPSASLPNSYRSDRTESAVAYGRDDSSRIVVVEATPHTWIAPLREALGSADTTTIHIVHYGDSQLEGDRMTTNLRRRLQTRYGGSGAGLIPLHQTISSRTIHQMLTMNGKIQSTGEGPKRYLAYGPKKNRRENAIYGVMGQVAMMNDSLCAGSEEMSLRIEPMTNEKYPARYFNRIRVLCDGDIHVSIDHAQVLSSGYYALPDSTTRCTIQLQGRGEVYGIGIESDHGIMVDNIPMRGCAGTIFTGIRSAQLTDYFSATSTRLIILQYGGNVIPYSSDTASVYAYIKRIRAQVRYLQHCAPQAGILFIGPSDMLTTIDGHKTSYPILPVMDHALKKMAQEENIGYWSLLDAMGGIGGMLSWQQRGWAGSDGVHFTRKGADQAGEMLAQYILEQLAAEE